ncbi:MAG: hypothetical protein K6A30_00985 [Lachnospiraceae bacterium]|nr:hypothetical protein [Lachnospiraceae bacterium]
MRIREERGIKEDRRKGTRGTYRCIVTGFCTNGVC